MLRKTWERISETGITTGLVSTIARPVRLLNRSVLLITVTSIIFFVLEIIAGEHRFLPFGLCGLLLFILTYWFTRKKRYITARFYFASVCWLFVAGMSVLSGEKAGTQYFYFAGVIIPFILFNEKRYIFILELINASIFTLTLLYFKNYNPIITIDEKTGTEFHYLVILFNIIIMFLLVLYLKNDQWHYEHRLAAKNAEIAEKNKEILDSITYAKRIQSAILPPKKLVKEYLHESFILYKPKDIVAGDFYWLQQISSPPAKGEYPKGEYPKGEGVISPAKGNHPVSHSADTPPLKGGEYHPVSSSHPSLAGGEYHPVSSSHPSFAGGECVVYFAAADCTGHGVPGAMVSVVCNNALNRTVREYGLTDPGQILDKARELVVAEFEKSEEDVKDGMDIALCALQGHILQYAGANNPLWLIRKNEDGVAELVEVKPDKQPIGKYTEAKPFTTHTIELQKGDSIYIFSDGFADQFGGPKGKKLKSKNFKQLLLSIQDKTMEEQSTIIDQKFEEWKGDLEQVDDVCVIGVRL